MSDVIEVFHHQIEITILRVVQVREQLLDELFGDGTSQLKAHGPFVKQLLRRFFKLILQTVLQGRVALVPQKYRVRYVAFIVCVSVGQHRQTERVEHFNRTHIDTAAVNTGEIEREEIQVVVRMQCVTVEFDVSFDLQVLAGFEQRPRRSRKAHSSYVEV